MVEHLLKQGGMMSGSPRPVWYYQPRPDKRLGRTTWAADVLIYLLWGLVGLLFVLALAGMLSIGILVLPFAIGTSGLAAYATFGRAFRPQCIAGVMIPVALGIGWLGSWSTFVSDDPADHCYRSSGGTTCESSSYTDASGQTVDTMPHHSGELPSGFQWSHTWPYVAVAIAVLMLGVVVFVSCGVGVRRTNARRCARSDPRLPDPPDQ